MNSTLCSSYRDEPSARCDEPLLVVANKRELSRNRLWDPLNAGDSFAGFERPGLPFANHALGRLRATPSQRGACSL